MLILKSIIGYFIKNTFNYPTLAEAYKIAGLDAVEWDDALTWARGTNNHT